MAYRQNNSRGVEYHLNSKVVVLRNSKAERTIYYFSKDARATACDIPKGMEVVENPRNGFLTLKKKAA